MKSKDAVKSGFSLGTRHLQAAMIFFGILLAYTMRINMSMAVVAMTDDADEHHFTWSVKVQSVILSSFFWGYFVLQVPSGELATKFGGMKLLALSIGGNAVVSLLTPVSAYYGGWRAVCGCRVLQGLLQGLAYPSTHNLIGKWVPLEEKSRVGGFIYAGSQLGMALQMVSSGFIADYWGWPAIFYVDGALGTIWTAIYLYFGADSPQSSGIISAAERTYIEDSIGQAVAEKRVPTPWRAIVTSLPFLALLVAHCAQSWGMWTLMTEMPSYFKKVLQVDIKANGVISAIPYLAMYVLSFPFGVACDYVLKNKVLSITATRKLSNSIGLFIPAALLVALSFTPEGNVPVAVSLLTLAVGINAGHLTGFLLVHIDMSPRFAGTLMGITNCVASLISIAAPIVAGVVLKDETDAKDWQNVFYISSAIYAAGNLFYVTFGSSERQPWNDGTGTKKLHGAL